MAIWSLKFLLSFLFFVLVRVCWNWSVLMCEGSQIRLYYQNMLEPYKNVLYWTRTGFICFSSGLEIILLLTSCTPLSHSVINSLRAALAFYTIINLTSVFEIPVYSNIRVNIRVSCIYAGNLRVIFIKFSMVWCQIEYYFKNIFILPLRCCDWELIDK